METKIELYKKIKELLSRLNKYHLYPYYGEMYHRQINSMNEEILHFMQIGEDSLAIIQEELDAENKVREEFLNE